MTLRDRLIEEGEKKGLERGRAEGLEEGRAEGEKRGLTRGRAEGRAELLVELLADRFGPVPEKMLQRIRSADDEEFLRWSHRLLRAQSIADVFEDS